MPERDVRDFARKNELPVIESPCPADKNTQREEMKQLLHSLERQNKGLRYRIFGAITRGELDGFRDTGKMEGIKTYSESDAE
jgi:tRNA(Ile)-lysidine synthase TilS/MesJ